MTPLPRTAALRLVLASLALASLLPYPAFAAIPEARPQFYERLFREYKPEGAELEKAIWDEKNPYAAAGFVRDVPRQEREKARSPKGFSVLLASALELKDIGELLSKGPIETRNFRLGLTQRPMCTFCQKQGETLAWLEKYYAPVAPERAKALRQAYWDWAELGAHHREYLTKSALDRTKWAALTFPQRQDKMRAWALAERDAILKLNPRTRAELEMMAARHNDAAAVLPADDAISLLDHYNEASEAVMTLESVTNNPALIDTPEKKALLDKVNAAKTVGERLAALNALFDANKVDRPSLRIQAPATEAQAFTDKTRVAVAEVIRTRMLEEISGTWAGDDLRAFYAKTPLRIAIKKPDSAAEAWYQGDDVLYFNERRIEQYVKSLPGGKTVEDLLKDPKLVGPLVRELAPVFVHEAVHHQQHVWERENKIPPYWAQHHEQEAMMVHALYVNEKARRDPTYAAFLEESAAKGSMTTRLNQGIADRLHRLGATAFGPSVVADHYPENLSLEGTVWCNMVLHNAIDYYVSAEKERRAKLGDDARKKLDANPRIGDSFPSSEAFIAALRKAPGEQLDFLLKTQHDYLSVQPEIYAKYRRRLADATATTDRRYNELLGEADPTKKGKKGEVPPP